MGEPGEDCCRDARGRRLRRPAAQYSWKKRLLASIGTRAFATPRAAGPSRWRQDVTGKAEWTSWLLP